MTNFSDEYLTRINTSGEAKEVTQGVVKEGFADPSGEYPKREYFYDTSINKLRLEKKSIDSQSVVVT